MKCYIASKPELTGQKLSDTFFAYNRDSTLALLYEDGLLLYVFLLQFFTVDVLFYIMVRELHKGVSNSCIFNMSI